MPRACRSPCSARRRHSAARAPNSSSGSVSVSVMVLIATERSGRSRASPAHCAPGFPVAAEGREKEPSRRHSQQGGADEHPVHVLHWGSFLACEVSLHPLVCLCIPCSGDTAYPGWAEFKSRRFAQPNVRWRRSREARRGYRSACQSPIDRSLRCSVHSRRPRLRGASSPQTCACRERPSSSVLRSGCRTAPRRDARHHGWLPRSLLESRRCCGRGCKARRSRGCTWRCIRCLGPASAKPVAAFVPGHQPAALRSTEAARPTTTVPPQASAVLAQGRPQTTLPSAVAKGTEPAVSLAVPARAGAEPPGRRAPAIDEPHRPPSADHAPVARERQADAARRSSEQRALHAPGQEPAPRERPLAASHARAEHPPVPHGHAEPHRKEERRE